MVKNYYRKASLASQSGFSLVELAMVMLVSGLVSVSILEYYKIYSDNKRVEATNQAITLVQGATREFLNATGAYPCPADPGLPPDDPDYGLPVCNGEGDSEIVEGLRDIDGDAVMDDVLIGAVPIRGMLEFYELNGITKDVPLTEAAAYDGWGNKLTYAVTRSQTDSATFDQRAGVISVVDENDQNILEPVNSAHFIVTSHGPNGMGAYGSGGNVSEDCTPIVIPAIPPPGAVITPRNERDNCDYIDATFVSALKNDTDLSIFDDTLQFFSFEQTDLWRPSPTLDYYAYNTNAGFVGFNQPEPEEMLDIEGRLQASQVDAQQVCDRGGADCMPIELLAGDDDAMQCPAGQALTEVAAGGFRTCADYRQPIPAGFRCPAGEVMRGYSQSVPTNGGLICVPRP